MTLRNSLRAIAEHARSVSKSITIAAFLIGIPFAVAQQPANCNADHEHPPRYCCTCQRDAHGRIKRSTTARRHFQQLHPCPENGATSGACPGYIVDHVIPLYRGGADDPSNMQWQSLAESAAKDRDE